MKTNKFLQQARFAIIATALTLFTLSGINKVNAHVPVVPGEGNNHVFIPNCFTPNGDGKNDVFMVFSDQIKRISLRIFDSKGVEIFSTIQMDKGWDGKYYNREMGQDVYLYRIEVGYLDGEEEIIVGQLNLMR